MPFFKTSFLCMYNEVAVCVLRERGRRRRADPVTEAEQKLKQVLTTSSEEYCTYLKKWDIRMGNLDWMLSSRID